MKRLALSLLVILGVTALAIGATRAFFSDTETSTGNTFQAGAIDLKVDNQSYYNGAISDATSWQEDDLPGHFFFNFNDLKPSDWGEDTISLHVKDNEAWACMNLKLTENIDNTCTEPELLDDPSCTPGEEATGSGELAQNVNFIFWIDDGDNVLEQGEYDNNVIAQGPASDVLNNNYTIADSVFNRVGAVGEGLFPHITYFIGKAWCFGALTPNPLPEGQGVNPTVNSGILCNGENLNNATQTDLLKADVSFSVEQHRNNPNFLCNPRPTPSPTPIACVSTYAATSSNNNQGTRKNGTPVTADRTNPASMFGLPQSLGTPYDNPVVPNSFFSLGFDNGNIVLGFAAPFYNQAGDDLKIYEVTGGSSYPDEKVQVEVASDPSGPWTNLGLVTRDGTIDMGSVQEAQFVRLTDESTKSLFESTADGYDVDAVEATCGTNPQ